MDSQCIDHMPGSVDISILTIDVQNGWEYIHIVWFNIPQSQPLGGTTMLVLLLSKPNLSLCPRYSMDCVGSMLMYWSHTMLLGPPTCSHTAFETSRNIRMHFDTTHRNTNPRLIAFNFFYCHKPSNTLYWIFPGVHGGVSIYLSHIRFSQPHTYSHKTLEWEATCQYTLSWNITM